MLAHEVPDVREGSLGAWCWHMRFLRSSRGLWGPGVGT